MTNTKEVRAGPMFSVEDGNNPRREIPDLGT